MLGDQRCANYHQNRQWEQDCLQLWLNASGELPIEHISSFMGVLLILFLGFSISLWLLMRAQQNSPSGCDFGGFFRTRPSCTQPDLQTRFVAGLGTSPYSDAFSLGDRGSAACSDASPEPRRAVTFGEPRT